MLPYNKNLKNIARQLRKNMTDGERALWSRLRGKQLLGVQFYRQKPIGGYVVDFFAPKANLVIEIDGSQHLERGAVERDQQRDRCLAGLGLDVMRFNSREALTNTEEVVEAVCRKMKAKLAD
jgi:very-short-patch-repair endonuclease